MSNQKSKALGLIPHSTWDDDAKVTIEQFVDLKFALDSQRAPNHLLVYLFAGIFDLSIQGSTFRRVLPHQCIFLAAQEEFSMCASTEASFLAVHFIPRCLVDLSGLMHQDLTYTSRIIESDPYISEVFGMIDKELSNRDMHSELALSSLSNYVGIYLVRNHSKVAPFDDPEISRPDLCKINQALEYIESNLGGEMQIPEIAEDVELSMFRF